MEFDKERYLINVVRSKPGIKSQLNTRDKRSAQYQNRNFKYKERDDDNWIYWNTDKVGQIFVLRVIEVIYVTKIFLIL